MDLEVTQIELCEFLTYMIGILHYPIPNKNCIVGDKLQQDIVLVMEKCLNQLFEKIDIVNIVPTQSLLCTSINKYFECCVLITGNQIFMKDQYDKTMNYSQALKQKIRQMSKHF